MCAILSWAGKLKRGQWAEVHELLTELMIASACRGTDATGFAALDRQGNMIADKNPTPSARFTSVSMAWSRLWYPLCVIGHCRAATHGAPLNPENNHPFMGDNHAVVVNGVTPSYEEVAAEHGLTLTSECDSEVLLRLVEASAVPSDGVQDCLDFLDGGFATAVLDARRKQVLLARNERRPTWLLRLAHLDGVFACSTREIADTALRAMYGRGYGSLVSMLMPLAANSVTRIASDGRIDVAATRSREPVRRGLWLA